MKPGQRHNAKQPPVRKWGTTASYDAKYIREVAEGQDMESFGSRCNLLYQSKIIRPVSGFLVVKIGICYTPYISVEYGYSQYC